MAQDTGEVSAVRESVNKVEKFSNTCVVDPNTVHASCAARLKGFVTETVIGTVVSRAGALSETFIAGGVAIVGKTVTDVVQLYPLVLRPGVQVEVAEPMEAGIVDPTALISPPLGSTQVTDWVAELPRACAPKFSVAGVASICIASTTRLKVEETDWPL